MVAPLQSESERKRDRDLFRDNSGISNSRVKPAKYANVGAVEREKSGSRVAVTLS